MKRRSFLGLLAGLPFVKRFAQQRLDDDDEIVAAEFDFPVVGPSDSGSVMFVNERQPAGDYRLVRIVLDHRGCVTSRELI